MKDLGGGAKFVIMRKFVIGGKLVILPPVGFPAARVRC